MRTTTYPTKAMVERRSAQSAEPMAAPLTKTIPFDYVFEFKLKGKDPNNVQDVVKLQDVVEISMQGVFVGVSIGYSFVLDESKIPPTPIVIDETPPPPTPVLLNIPGGGEGEPRRVRIAGSPNTDMAVLRLIETQSQRLVTGVDGNEDVQKFVDILSNPTENQSEVIITTGPDGIAEFTLPDESEDLVTGGICVWDRGNNLFSSPLQSGVVGPKPGTGTFPAIGDDTVFIYGFSSQIATVLLFEGRTRKCFQVQTDAGNTEFNFNENGWAEIKLIVAEPGQPAVQKKLAPGDLLVVRLKDIRQPPDVFAVPSPRRAGDISVGALLRGLSSSSGGITSGFRPNQRLANFVAANPPLGRVSGDLLENGFELARGAEEISFLYSIDIVSSGRELQNKPIHNIAGLGIANGDRPFRPFARPIAFEPRSVIRIQIEELATLPGTLYIVLQGYKTLGTGRRPE